MKHFTKLLEQTQAIKNHKTLPRPKDVVSQVAMNNQSSKQPSGPLGVLLSGRIPVFRLPELVLRQLVGYYGDWRRSRDVLNNIDELRAPRPHQVVTRHGSSVPGSSNSLRLQ